MCTIRLNSLGWKQNPLHKSNCVQVQRINVIHVLSVGSIREWKQYLHSDSTLIKCSNKAHEKCFTYVLCASLVMVRISKKD